MTEVEKLRGLLERVAAVADERDKGYAARRHGGVVNGRCADSLVAMLPDIRAALAEPQGDPEGEHAFSVLETLLTWTDEDWHAHFERYPALAERVSAQLPKGEPAPAQDEQELNDAIHQMAFEVGDPAEDASGYWFDMESFNEFVEKLLPIVREPYEDVLRSLACSLGAGGYNAPTVDPVVFEQKIRWGIDELTANPAQTEQQSVEVMRFQYRHPKNGEAHIVSLTRDEVANGMDDALFQKLTETFCKCQPVGETNVVECRCDEYADEFEKLAAPIAQTAPQPEQSKLYTCIGKGGEYELIGRAQTAGSLKMTGRFADEVIVYRDTESGAFFCRSPGDFRLRMARAALAAKEA